MPRAALEGRIEELCHGLQMEPFAKRLCGKLSTGQQQRVSIARALLHDPPVLVLDEPTSGLDILSAQFILGLLREERSRGKSILFSTHAMAEAELLCDEIGLLHKGELLARGTLDGLLAESGARTLSEAFLAAIAAVDPGALPGGRPA
jgi:sodium transport system ATP-binding protein